MINNAPIRERLLLDRNDIWPRSWVTWFTQAVSALAGWKKTFTATKTHDFGSINSAAEASTTVTVTGARAGDGVVVMPSANTAGIIETAVVTASDQVTIYAKNFTGGAIDPSSKTYRVIVFQQ